MGRTSFGTRSIDRAQTNLRAANLPVFNLPRDKLASCADTSPKATRGANLSHGRLPKRTKAERPTYAVSPGGTIWGGERLSGASESERLSAANKSGANQGDLSMPIETILMIVALIVAILVLAIGLRPPPLYSDKERLPKREDLNAKKDE